MSRRLSLGDADFSVTVYGGTPPAGVSSVDPATQCDPFWTQLNGGYCSDALGNYIRRDGSIIRVDGVVPNAQRLIAGVSNEALLAGVGVLALLLLVAAVQR